MFEAGRVERRRQRGGHAGFVDITQLGADRTAPETEMLRRLRADAETAPTPQAGPPRLEKVPLEAPERLAVVDFLHPLFHGDDATQVRSHMEPVALDDGRRKSRSLPQSMGAP